MVADLNFGFRVSLCLEYPDVFSVFEALVLAALFKRRGQTKWKQTTALGFSLNTNGSASEDVLRFGAHWPVRQAAAGTRGESSQTNSVGPVFAFFTREGGVPFFERAQTQCISPKEIGTHAGLPFPVSKLSVFAHLALAG